MAPLNFSISGLSLFTKLGETFLGFQVGKLIVTAPVSASLEEALATIISAPAFLTVFVSSLVTCDLKAPVSFPQEDWALPMWLTVSSEQGAARRQLLMPVCKRWLVPP